MPETEEYVEVSRVEWGQDETKVEGERIASVALVVNGDRCWLARRYPASFAQDIADTLNVFLEMPR